MRKMGVPLTNKPSMVRGSILGEFKRLAQTLQLNPIALMKRAGISRRYLDDPELTLPMRAIVELLEIAALSSGIEDFGLRLAENRGLPDLGPVTLMLREEANVRDALRTLIAFLHLHSDALYMHLEEGADPIFTIDIIVGGAHRYRQAMDTSVASAISILRWLLGEDWSPASVCFMHSPPVSRARFKRFFRCPVDFLADFNGIVLHKSDLDKPLPTSSPALRRQVERYIRIINVESRDSFVHQVTQVIAMALPRGDANAEKVAGYLGIDRRTLNRHLSKADLNYSAVLQNVRHHLATQYLLGSDRSLSEIAGLSGFDSLSTFSRWFRASFNSSATAWRKLQRVKKSTGTRMPQMAKSVSQSAKHKSRMRLISSSG
jgi:AraC-like DNA-binding protein